MAAPIGHRPREGVHRRRGHATIIVVEVAVAAICAGCRIAIPPTERIAGTRRGRCPNCGPDVEVIHVALTGPMNLVATFPTPRPPPAGVALERPATPAQPPAAPVGDGPFRTPGRLRIERRAAGLARIRLPNRKRGLAAWPLSWIALAWMLPAFGSAFTLPMVLTVPALGWIVALARHRSFIELSPSSVWVRDGKRTTLRLDRARITHIRCVCPNPTGFGPPDVPWDVWVTVDGIPTCLVAAESLEHATAIAELLTHELGLPTWVPVPRLPGPRR